MTAGRPTKYDKELHCKIAKLCALAGMIDREIADELDIDVATLYRWKQKYKEFCDSLKENKDVIDEKVKNKLLTRAMGYQYKEVHIEEVELIGKDRENETIKLPAIKTKTITKEVVPDVTAQIFWLKNRQPHSWRDTKEINVESQSFAEWVKTVSADKE